MERKLLFLKRKNKHEHYVVHSYCYWLYISRQCVRFLRIGSFFFFFKCLSCLAFKQHFVYLLMIIQQQFKRSDQKPLDGLIYTHRKALKTLTEPSSYYEFCLNFFLSNYGHDYVGLYCIQKCLLLYRVSNICSRNHDKLASASIWQ